MLVLGHVPIAFSSCHQLQIVVTAGIYEHTVFEFLHPILPNPCALYLQEL